MSCRAAAGCTGVGNYDTGFGTTLTLAESWDGKAWAIQRTADPRGTIVDGMFGVSCFAAAACVGVGSNIHNDEGASRSLAERWDGHAWVIQRLPSPR